ncbi:AMP-binding protein, partial [Candidatus Poribacteria bacterium]|nr:AMP-binding protein [Candidatus Poribacteria bacterium]
MSAEQARSIPYTSRTLPRILSLQAARHGDKTLIASASRSITYGGAPDIAARSAGRLAAAGVQAGDRVIAFLPNGMDLVELWFGAAWLGAVLVPINTEFRGEQLRHA